MDSYQFLLGLMYIYFENVVLKLCLICWCFRIKTIIIHALIIHTPLESIQYNRRGIQISYYPTLGGHFDWKKNQQVKNERGWELFAYSGGDANQLIFFFSVLQNDFDSETSILVLPELIIHTSALRETFICFYTQNSYGSCATLLPSSRECDFNGYQPISTFTELLSYRTIAKLWISLEIQ